MFELKDIEIYGVRISGIKYHKEELEQCMKILGCGSFEEVVLNFIKDTITDRIPTCKEDVEGAINTHTEEEEQYLQHLRKTAMMIQDTETLGSINDEIKRMFADKVTIYIMRKVYGSRMVCKNCSCYVKGLCTSLCMDVEPFGEGCEAFKHKDDEVKTNVIQLY